MISRAAYLTPVDFHQKVLADPYCDNLQVSVDIKPNGEVVPDRDRIKILNESPKVMFRFKTTMRNVDDFIALHDEFKIKRVVMETALRLPGEPHYYGTKTPLEKRNWRPTSEYLRCNTTCANCPHENGFLACAATAKMLAVVPAIKRPPPPRQRVDQLNPPPSGSQWAREAIRCMFEHGGSVSVKDSYAWFLEKYPILKFGKANWQFKVRIALQRQGMRVCPKCGKAHMTPPYTPGVYTEPVHYCDCGAKLLSIWHLRPAIKKRITEQPELTLFIK